MIVMYKERVISLSDLRWVCITCEKCKTSITLDMTREREPRAPNLPTHCQICDTAFDSAVSNLNGLKAAFKELFKLSKTKPDAVTFISDEEDTEMP
jgi:hypothetical protein